MGRVQLKVSLTKTIALTQGLSRRRTYIFRGIGILIPFLLLFVLELGLRLFHYGYNTDLFIEDPADQNYYVLNPDAAKKYFTDQQLATRGNSEPFKKEKDEHTLRIFVLGESTTIGYPYFHNASFHRWLQFRLSHTFPDRNFEVINIALTAVNSYTVLGFAKEVVDYHPDAILIYTGHNEYYGALGVGSTDKIGGSRMIVKGLLHLRDWKITQLMTNGYERIARLFRRRQADPKKTRMELMVADQEIPYGSKLYQRGLDQFRMNMKETLALFDKKKIPVFISNLVSNEKDLRPFITTTVDSLHFPGFISNYADGLKAWEKKDLTSASILFRQADQVWNGHALCNYYLGCLAIRQGDSIGARNYFYRAKDLDALRFRAPESINEIIGTLSSQYKNVTLVDSRKAFEIHSDNGIIGDEYLLEHVHPNLQGYALLSDVFYEAMKQQGILSFHEEKEMSFRELLGSMPVLKVDSLTGAFKIAKLKKSWPFNDSQSGPPISKSLNSQIPQSSIPTIPKSRNLEIPQSQTIEEKLAFDLAFHQLNWTGAIDTLYNYYIGRQDWINARTLVEALVLEHPTEEAYYEKAANLCGETQDYENTAFYFKRSFSMSPSFEKARKLFVIYLQLDRPVESLPYLDYAIRNNSAGLGLGPIKQLVVEVMQLQGVAEKNKADLSILNRIAEDYFKMGNREGAAKYIDLVLKADPANKEALHLNNSLKKG